MSVPNCTICGDVGKALALCKKHYYAQRYIKQRERIRALNKAWRASSPKYIAYLRAKARDPEERARLRAGKKANPEKVRADKKQWHARNYEKTKAASRRWKKRNPENGKAHFHNRRARLLGASGSHTAEQILRMFADQRGQCAICTKQLLPRYHKDHIVPLSKGGSNDISNIQLLCVSCNCSKKDKMPW